MSIRVLSRRKRYWAWSDMVQFRGVIGGSESVYLGKVRSYFDDGGNAFGGDSGGPPLLGRLLLMAMKIGNQNPRSRK